MTTLSDYIVNVLIFLAKIGYYHGNYQCCVFFAMQQMKHLIYVFKKHVKTNIDSIQNNKTMLCYGLTLCLYQ